MQRAITNCNQLLRDNYNYKTCCNIYTENRKSALKLGVRFDGRG